LLAACADLDELGLSFLGSSGFLVMAFKNAILELSINLVFISVR
jgi:hypothetical protein